MATETLTKDADILIPLLILYIYPITIYIVSLLLYNILLNN